MTDDQALLIELTDVLNEMDTAQSWINHARIAAPTNQVVQSELDRQQINLNYNRARIEAAIKLISSRN